MKLCLLSFVLVLDVVVSRTTGSATTAEQDSWTPVVSLVIRISDPFISLTRFCHPLIFIQPATLPKKRWHRPDSADILIVIYKL